MSRCANATQNRGWFSGTAHLLLETCLCLWSDDDGLQISSRGGYLSRIMISLTSLDPGGRVFLLVVATHVHSLLMWPVLDIQQ